MGRYFVIQTMVELFASGLLIYGFMHEDKVIAFEQAVKRLALGHYRRLRRKIVNKIIDRKVAKINEIGFNKH